MYGIRFERTFFGPRGQRGWMKENGAILAFATRDDALAWIEKADTTVYRHSHGEHSRPQYRVRKLPSRSSAP